MMDTLRRFLKDRKLELCAEKMKIIVFNKQGKEKKELWKWENKEIEEVQSFKYFNREGDYDDHKVELSKKERMAARKIWGLEESLCRDDFIRR